jgi:two-component system sensor histidine kinase KdpD
MRRIDPRQLARPLAVAVVSLGVATLMVWLLETYVGVPTASAVYLAAVVAIAIVGGTAGAIAAAIASFLLYNFLFTEPYFTFTIRDPGDVLSVILLLFVGIVVGQLAALQRSRAEVAVRREREAWALFRVSRALATRDSTPAVLPEIAAILVSETQMERAWFSLGPDDARERVAADTGSDAPPALSGRNLVLRRMPGDEPAQWIRVHQPASARTRQAASREAYRVRIVAGGNPLGSIWAVRDRRAGQPDRTETRLLAAAADQLGQGLAHDRLAAEAQAAEIARQSDALKSALLQSVSHDFRTPLATIRAAAGTLRPGLGLSSEDQKESVDAIDREVEYLNRLGTNLLDLSRIEAGALRADRDVFELEDLVERILERLRPRLADRPLEVELTVSPIEVDPIFFEEAFTNVLENAIKYTVAGTMIRILARDLGDGYVRLSVEDAGAGVPPETLPRLFEKFYRVPGDGRGSRSGTGIGLAVVLGLVEAMGGRVAARRSDLGGLAIDLDLPAASVPAELVKGDTG